VAKQLHAVGPASIDIGEANELVGVLRYRRRGRFVVALHPNRVAVAQREDDGTLDLGHLAV